MTTFYSVLSMVLLFGYWLLIAGVTIRILYKRRTVPSAMAWLLVIYILPLLGIIAYALFGELRLGNRRAKHAQTLWPSTLAWLSQLKNNPYIFTTHCSDTVLPLFQLSEQRQGIPAFRDNQTQLFTTCNDTMLAMIQDIESAQQRIDMVFYIWQSGGTVDAVTQALVAAAERGVHCRLMLDSAGSMRFLRSIHVRKLTDAGVEVIEALKVNLFRALFRRMDLRQHRKIVLIDDRVAYLGSMNMVDPRFFKQNSGVGHWIDMMVRVEGPVATMISVIYACDWEMETGERLFPPVPQISEQPPADETGHFVHIVPSGPGFPEELIHQTFLTAVYSSRERLILTTPYFVPSDDLLHAICTAALRGVDVRLILPKKNDSLMVNWACRAFYQELLEAGVKIHLFENDLLHSKSILIDEQVSLVGTVNLDIRSLWLNFEITMVVDDKTFANDLAIVHQDYLKHSTLLTLETWQDRPVWHRIIERIFYFFSPLL